MRKFVVLLMILLIASASGCIFKDTAAPNNGSASSGDTGIVEPTDDGTPVVDEALAKMPEDLQVVIEYEEEHPGRGYEVAGDLVLGSDGIIRCRIHFDPALIEVILFNKPAALVPNDQPATQLVVDYGGTPISTLDMPSNSVYAIMPLDRLKDLAQEEAVTKIVPGRNAMEKPVP